MTEGRDAGCAFGLSQFTTYMTRRLALEAGIRIVATSPNRYVHPSDQPLYEVSTGREKSVTHVFQHIPTEAEWRDQLDRYGVPTETQNVALGNARALAAHCTASLTTAAFPDTSGMVPIEKLCRGAMEKMGLENPTYLHRLEHELKVIHDKGIAAVLRHLRGFHARDAPQDDGRTRTGQLSRFARLLFAGHYNH
jgi:hypothetical protein